MKYWIYTEKHVCVLCGKEDIWKERRYDKKPKEWIKRNRWFDRVCATHFL